MRGPVRNFNCSAPIVSMGLLEVSLGGVGVKLGPPGGLPGRVGVSMGLLEVSQGVWEAGWGLPGGLQRGLGVKLWVWV